MTTYVEDHHHHHHHHHHRYNHLPTHTHQVPYIDDRRNCRPYHHIVQSHPVHVPPPTHLVSQPQYLPTPPNQYHQQHRPEPAAPQIPRPYHPHAALTPSPRAHDPASYFIGSWSKDKFIEMTAFMLDTAAELNNSYVALPNYTQPESVYFSVSRPDIPTKDYVRRLVTYTRCSPAAFVLMLIYIDRIAVSNKLLLVTPYNMHRLLVTALTLACKYLDDRCYSNVHYAKVGGIPTAREMNRLELQFLKYLDYRLHVEREDYWDKLATLMKASPPSSPTTIMHCSSPLTPSSGSPTAIMTSPVSAIPTMPPSDQRPPLPIERILDFDGHYGLSRMVDDNAAIDITLDSSSATPKKAKSYPQPRQHPTRPSPDDRWLHWNSSPRPPAQRSIRRKTSRRDGTGAASLDPRFYHATHPSAMPMRYAECAP